MDIGGAEHKNREVIKMWKQIDGFSAYEVSDDGQVRHGNKLVKARKNTTGYLQVWIKSDEGL